MKSFTKKRLPTILAAGLTALAVATAGLPAPATAADATISGLTKKQQKAKKKALKKCNKKKGKNKKQTKKKKKKCKKQVNKKYNNISKKNSQNNAPKGVTKVVNLGDDYFSPNDVSLNVNDSIKWSWAQVGAMGGSSNTLSSLYIY